MARFISILGFLNGKLQNTVTATVKGQSTIRAYQPNVSNPATAKQVSNREVMTWITNLANYLNFILLVPYLTPKRRQQSATNAFNQQIGKIISLIATDENIIRSEVITGNLVSLFNSNLMVTNGPKSYIPTATPTGSAATTTSTTMNILVTTQSANYSRADLSNDVYCFAAVNVSSPTVPTVTISTIAREAGEYENDITLPTRAATDIVLIFAFFKGANNDTTSKGMVIGRLTGIAFTATTARTYSA